MEYIKRVESLVFINSIPLLPALTEKNIAGSAPSTKPKITTLFLFFKTPKKGANNIKGMVIARKDTVIILYR